MEHIRFVDASIFFDCMVDLDESGAFQQEYYGLSMVNNDPIGQWLKSSRMRKEVNDSDQVLLTLLVDLHRKVDLLTRIVQEKGSDLYLPLEEHLRIDGVAHDGYIRVPEAHFEVGARYYARIELPMFPKRVSAFYFEALTSTHGKIVLMHEEDVTEWDVYVATCERAMIRQMKGHNSEY